LAPPGRKRSDTLQSISASASWSIAAFAKHRLLSAIALPGASESDVS
jgi:hypothetical protein